MTFEWPLALLGLVLVPAVAGAYVLVERRRARYALRFTNVSVLRSVLPPSGGARWRRFVPPAVFLLALTGVLVGLARPEVARSIQREQATIVLVIDTSGSMVADDVQPTRLAAAQEAARRFIRKLPGRFRVGLVSFSTDARVTIPITEDHAVAIQGVEHMTAFGGTAIGDAIRRAVDLLRPGRPANSANLQVAGSGPPSAIVLLSDGAQNQGRLLPLQGAALAKRQKIPVHAVALGTPEGTIRISEGGLQEVLSVPPDPRTLKRIALETGGRFYAVANEARLNAVYEGLASRLSVRREQREITFVFLGASSLLLVAAGVLSALWLPRLP